MHHHLTTKTPHDDAEMSNVGQAKDCLSNKEK